MAFAAPIAKDKLAAATDDAIRQIPGTAMAASDRDEEWDKALEARVKNIPAAGAIMNDISNEAIANDRSRDADIIARFNALLSDVERIAVFNGGTRVEQSQITPNKPRLKAVFQFLGPEFQKAYKRAEKGQAIKPFKASALFKADRDVKFVKSVK
jgi:hypothetical protein